MSPHDGLTSYRTVRQAYEQAELSGEVRRDAAQLTVGAAPDQLIADN